MTDQIFNETTKEIIVSQQPHISYHHLYRGKEGATYFANMYFPIYDIDVSKLCEQYLLLVFVDALIYKADEEIELEQANKSQKTVHSIWKPIKKLILSLVKELNIYHSSIEFYLEELEQYWELETKLMNSQKFLIEDVIKAQKLRTADGRILHSILLQLIGKSFDNNIFHLIWPVEVWVEFESDIVEYEKDLKNGHYNAYRMFEKFYSHDFIHDYKTQSEYYESLFQERLKHLPSHEQNKYYRSYNFCQEDIMAQRIS